MMNEENIKEEGKKDNCNNSDDISLITGYVEGLVTNLRSNLDI